MSDLFRPFTAGLPISLIATPREDLMTCAADDRIGDVAERNVAGYDHIPVVDAAGHIAAVVSTPNDLPASGYAGEHATALSGAHVIGADSPIISFIREVETQPFRFVVDESGIAGLVTWSDMQKLAARAALFALVTQLEMCMAAVIERAFPSEGWRDRLKKTRLDRIEAEIAKAKDDDSFVSALLYTQLCDKRDILAGAMGGKGFLSDLKKIEALRNDLAHANRIADRRDKAFQLGELVLLMERYIEELAGKSAGPE